MRTVYDSLAIAAIMATGRALREVELENKVDMFEYAQGEYPKARGKQPSTHVRSSAVVSVHDEDAAKNMNEPIKHDGLSRQYRRQLQRKGLM